MSSSCAFTEVDCIADIYEQPLDFLSEFSFYYLARLTSITSAILILTHLYHKKLRESPGDLIIGISASNLILAIHWDTNPENRFGCPCFLNGVVGVFAGFANFFYNLSFVVYLYQSLRHVLKQGKMIKPAFYHWFTLGISIFGTIVIISQNKIGQNLFGTCSTKFNCNRDVFRGVVTLLTYSLYQVLSFHLYFYMKRKLGSKDLEEGELAFVNNYRLYLLITSVLWTINVISFAYNDFSKHELGQEWGLAYKLFIPLGNFCKVFQAVVLTIYRYREPYVAAAIQKMVFFWQAQEKPNELQEKLLDNNANPGDVPLQVFSSNIGSDNSMHLIQSVSKKREISFTCTILSSVLIAEKKTMRDEDPLDPTDIDREIKEKHIFLMDHKLVTSKISYASQELKKMRVTIVDTTVEIVAPKIFQNIKKLSRYNEPVNFLESFNLILNKAKLNKENAGNGGKSGEFFFFSSDRKLVIKSISTYELETFLDILPDYYQHIIHHPNSLVARVYGLYILKWEPEVLPIMVMENLCGVPPDFVERKYDLKGSKYNRQVLGEEEYLDPNIAKSKTLKDGDFLRIEKTLNIPEEYKPKLLEVLDADVEFLCKAQLIDYSLALFLVNKKKYCDTKGLEFNPEGYSTDVVSEIPTSQSKEQCYKLGIIDFLQTYTVQKILEKNIKIVINMDPNLETSSQDPQYYKTRFQSFMRKILGLEINSSPRSTRVTKQFLQPTPSQSRAMLNISSEKNG